MNIGYACIALGVPGAQLRSCALKNADRETIANIVSSNLNALANIARYNAANGIKLFRISSGLIPFGSLPSNPVNWGGMVSGEFAAVGQTIAASGMRVSMHPGQYTVLNSPDPAVVEKSIDDLNYHAKVLRLLGTGPSHKIVLHIGGVYGDKTASVKRFIKNFRLLDDEVKSRLVLENDDRLFTVADVLSTAGELGLPVVFDTLHNEVNPAGERDAFEWIEQCRKTWEVRDGVQKIHYSQHNPLKKPGSHSDTVDASRFAVFAQKLQRDDVDIMLEVKDKNLSAVKCANTVRSDRHIKHLEREWARYKYLVLEKSAAGYGAIRELLKDKTGYPVEPFYSLLDTAMRKEWEAGDKINAAMHVWGYFKEKADAKEKTEFLNKLKRLERGFSSAAPVKKILWSLTQKYGPDYLKESYYFHF